MISQGEIGRVQAEVAQEVRERAFESREVRERAVPQRSLAEEYGEEMDEVERPMRAGWNVEGKFLRPGEGGRRRRRMR